MSSESFYSFTFPVYRLFLLMPKFMDAVKFQISDEPKYLSPENFRSRLKTWFSEGDECNISPICRPSIKHFKSILGRRPVQQESLPPVYIIYCSGLNLHS